MDYDAWEILEEINKHDLSQALVPLHDDHRHELIQTHIKSSVNAIAQEDPTFVDSTAEQLIEAVKNRLAHPENAQFHGNLALKSEYEQAVLLEMIRRAGRIFEETNSPHLGKLENKFSKKIYAAPEMDTFLHEVATVMRHLLLPTHPLIAAAIYGADFLLHYGDTLSTSVKFFSHDKSNQHMVHDYPIITQQGGIGWIKFETHAEHNISSYWCLWKKNVVELDAKRTYFFFETKEQFQVALMTALREKEAQEKKVLESWDVIEDTE